jgi:2-phospho-L-lactate transferase/gluconeogenesis factor (CofD/UPF0052 family)
MRGVVVGGGTGAPKSIRALLSMGIETSCVVAMADDGGSTGILRQVAGATPPGDIRKCLAAMATDQSAPMTCAFRRRFEFADNHALGNLLLFALEEQTGSFPEAIALCERLLDARGHVYPSTLSPVSLSAELSDGSVIAGQSRASHAPEALRRVWLQGSCEEQEDVAAQGGGAAQGSCEEQEDVAAQGGGETQGSGKAQGSAAAQGSSAILAYQPAVEALSEADVILLGPGSLFTSIIVNLLVPGIVEAIFNSPAKVIFVCPIADTQGETAGMSVRDCYEALCSHGLDGRIDAILVHWPAGVPCAQKSTRVTLCPEAESVAFGEEDRRAIEARGTRVIVADLSSKDMPTWHCEAALGDALREAMSGDTLREAALGDALREAMSGDALREEI